MQENSTIKPGYQEFPTANNMSILRLMKLNIKNESKAEIEMLAATLALKIISLKKLMKGISTVNLTNTNYMFSQKKVIFTGSILYLKPLDIK